jgi:synaptic vesicle membrane protein VAT-1
VEKVVINKPGGYKSLKLVGVPDCVPDDHEYCIEVSAAGVNYADIIIREGYYKAAKGRYPITPGFEFSGVITEGGKAAQGFSIGDKVFGYTLFGGYASRICVTPHCIRKIPEGWNLEEAAAIPTGYLTAYHALHNTAHAKKNDVVLIHSAAGGVGLAMLQLSRLIGCQAIAVVGHSSKLEIVKEFGASHAVLKGKRMWQEIDEIAPSGFDIILDSNGISTPHKGFQRLRPGGRLVVYGFAELFPRGGKPFLPLLIYKALQIPKINLRSLTSTNRAVLGFNLAYLTEQIEMANVAFNEVETLMKEGRIKKYPLRLFPISKVANAHAYLETGNSVGKILLTFN